MYTAIHRPNRIASAQKRFVRRLRKELRIKIPDIVVGYQGGNIKLPEVIANNRIWFAYQSLDGARIPRHWNAFGAGPPALRRSNSIVVEINPAIHGADGRVAGLFAVDDKTGNRVLLHRGHIGGGTPGIGQAAFMEWYPGDRVTFRDPSGGDVEQVAILVADLESSRFLLQLEWFVDTVRRFKASRRTDDPTRMSDKDLRGKAAAAPAKPKSTTTVVVAYERNRHVAELAKRRASGKCELCRKPAPFTNASDEPYLESHHIVWLAHGGLDSPENTVALCPNCHRKMHVVNDPKDIRKLQRRAGGARRG